MGRLRLFHDGWPLVIGLYDGRQCPRCGALACGKTARRLHRQDHADTDGRLLELERAMGIAEEEETRDPGGFIVGNGPLPASVRGGSDEDEEERKDDGS